MLYDVFICHASEDKKSFVHPLARMLKSLHIEVWYDEFTLKLGDSIKRSLDQGLRQSRFGIVILSKAFFSKKWPQYELDGLAEREMQGNDVVILPIWHGVTHDYVFGFSPSLANRRAISSSLGIKNVVRAILSVIRPQASPLIEARDLLIKWGITPPVITDEYWLHVIEASNRTPASGGGIPDESIWGRWSFPLPEKQGGPKHWGERLAWTAMQLCWVDAADKIPISPISEPKTVLEFIDSNPGLHEICELYPRLLIEYAPQLTIRGMGGDFESIFDELYNESLKESAAQRKAHSIVGTGLTINKDVPLCDVEWALRHPTFGNLESEYVVCEYFIGGMFGPPVSQFEHADHAFWLLSSASKWLPTKIRKFMSDGMAKWHAWQWWSLESATKKERWDSIGAFSDALRVAKKGKTFRWTERTKDDVLHRIAKSIELLPLPDTPREILKRFINEKFPEKYISAHINHQKRKQIIKSNK